MAKKFRMGWRSSGYLGVGMKERTAICTPKIATVALKQRRVQPLCTLPPSGTPRASERRASWSVGGNKGSSYLCSFFNAFERPSFRLPSLTSFNNSGNGYTPQRQDTISQRTILRKRSWVERDEIPGGCAGLSRRRGGRED